MNEKRFYRDMGIVHYSIVDKNTGNTYPIEDKGVFESICGLLDEQQGTISQLEQENTNLLSDKIRSLDEFEKCTNKLKKKILEQQATIHSLKDENEQLRKELGNFKPVMFQDVRKGTVILYSKGD